MHIYIDTVYAESADYIDDDVNNACVYSMHACSHCDDHNMTMTAHAYDHDYSLDHDHKSASTSYHIVSLYY